MDIFELRGLVNPAIEGFFFGNIKDMSLGQVLNGKKYNSFIKNFNRGGPISEKCKKKKIVTKIRKELKRRLKSNGIEDVAVKGREKNIYSIYRKIKSKHKPFSEILDVYGFRILVDSIDDCYRTLGIIHNYFSQI